MTGEPVLRRGRAADPTPAAVTPDKVVSVAASSVIPGNESVTQPNENQGELPGSQANVESPNQPKPVSDDPVLSSDAAAAVAETRQRRLRRLLKQCDRVLLLDFNTLAMPTWPDNFSLAIARRRRDVWLFISVLAALVFLSGLSGFVPAWVGGGGFGVLVVVLLAGVPFIRRLYDSRPSYLDVLMRRQRLLKQARAHVNQLEEDVGLVWQCAQMAEFNSVLKAPPFSALIRLSEQRILARSLTRREHIRLYLIYLLEAEKAYDRLQQAFFEGHQAAIDDGWVSVAASPEPR
ncbi:hypothetical protein [Marinobacter caseinilyticus]|uniref:hypothetical protein n=1 Tax=Marinobacter caseinilyticus TaxID=2692195 RepID=UPI001F1A77B7|nr:hypothetical protein [Marinobacter caseinilyticus]